MRTALARRRLVPERLSPSPFRFCSNWRKILTASSLSFSLPPGDLSSSSGSISTSYSSYSLPCRELAYQIAEQFRVLGATLNLHSTVVVGGMDMMTQAIELRKRPHVIIATPGRLCDMIRSNMGEWSLGKVKFLVSRLGPHAACQN